MYTDRSRERERERERDVYIEIEKERCIGAPPRLATHKEGHIWAKKGRSWASKRASWGGVGGGGVVLTEHFVARRRQIPQPANPDGRRGSSIVQRGPELILKHAHLQNKNKNGVSCFCGASCML